MSVVIGAAAPTFTRNATYFQLAGDSFAPAAVFGVSFKVLPHDEHKALQDSVIKGEVGLSDALDRVVAGWGNARDKDGNELPDSGLRDASGNAVPYSHEERKATEEKFQGFEQAIGIAYIDAWDFHQRGAALEAAKNFKAPSSTSTA